MFSLNKTITVEDLEDRADLRKRPENELVEIVFDINFYSDFFLALQKKKNLISVLRAMYVFTDDQLTCLKKHIEFPATEPCN
jgi:hypothetical protein